MIHDENRLHRSVLTTLAGLTPLLVAADEFDKALALAGAFLVAHTVSAAFSLLLPARFLPARVLTLAVLAAAASIGLYASVVRIVDPVLFELLGSRLYLVPFLGPVFSVALAPGSEADRDRGWERLVAGLGFAVVICLMGFLRQLLSSGIIGLALKTATHGRPILPVASQPAGALFLIGFGSAAIAAVTRAARRRSS